MGVKTKAGLVALLAGMTLGTGGGQAQGAVGLVSVGTFDEPTYVTGALGDPTRLYVVERKGDVKVLKDGQVSTFVDLTRYVSGLDGERGLLSIALAPDFGTSRRFYAYFTGNGRAPLKSGVGNVVVARLTASSADAADPATLEPLLQIPHTMQSNHNGGQLQFGPDGFLYAGTGDGGAGDDPAKNGQYLVDDGSAAGGGVDHSPLLAKVLRLDVSGATGAVAPPSNAFGPTGKAPEVWAYGVRNPYRFSFDHDTGDLVIGDVGQGHREEVDLLPVGTPAGTNLGWSQWEGTRVESGSPGRAGFTFPVLEYGHSDGEFGSIAGCSVTGGYVVRDPNLPELAGQYVYSDYCQSRIRAATLTATGSSGDRDLGLGDPGGSVISFGEDACGRVYVATQSGTVKRLSSSGACTVRPAPAGVPVVEGPPAGGGGDPGGGGGGTTTDTVAPAIKLKSLAAQRAVRTGHVRLQATCDEVCGLTTSGTFTVAGRSKRAKALKLHQRKDTLDVGATVRLDLTFSGATRKAISRALRAGRRVTARIVLVTSDGAGNRRTTVVSLRVRR